MKKSSSTGTKITFYPSDKIFTSTDFETDRIYKRIQELSFLNAGVSINVEDKRSGKSRKFKNNGGLSSYVTHLKGRCYTINIPQKDGGTHLAGFRGSLTRVLKSFIKKENAKKTPTDLLGEDVREGLIAIISVKVPDPKFSSQTKEKHVSSEVEWVVSTLFYKYFNQLINMCEKEHYPFEKPLHEIYKKEYCFSPIPSLAVHFTNVNSVYGISPNMNLDKLWTENEFNE